MCAQSGGSIYILVIVFNNIKVKVLKLLFASHVFFRFSDNKISNTQTNFKQQSS